MAEPIKLLAQQQIAVPSGHPTLALVEIITRLVDKIAELEAEIDDHETRITALEP